MAETEAILRNTKLSIEKETTEGTAVAETANGALLLTSDGAEFNISRDLIENDFMTGSLSRTAPSAGMWSDDLGLTIPTLMRGKGTLTQPDWSLLMESIMGTQSQNTDGTVDVGSTAISIVMKTGGDPDVGQLVYFPDQGEVRRVQTLSAGVSFTVWPPLPAAPSEDDDFICGTCWQLASSGHPSFTAYAYFDGPKRLRMAGCKTVTFEATFEVGANVPMVFTCRALSPLYDNTAQAVTPVYDTSTVPLRCLGIDMYVLHSGTVTGSPTTTETVLAAPTYDVAIGDSISIEVSAGVWETKTISNVVGNAGSNITLTHAAVSIAASATDTVYIHRTQCAGVGDTLTLTIEMESEFLRCMASTYGKKEQAFTGRTVTIAKTPYFRSWQEFLMRDDVVGSALSITLGDTLTNIVSIYIPNQINAEVSLTTDALMKNEVSSRAVVDSVLGNDHEIVIAAF